MSFEKIIYSPNRKNHKMLSLLRKLVFTAKFTPSKNWEHQYR
jgi:hypothetical protein